MVTSPLDLQRHLKVPKLGFDLVPFVDLCLVGFFFAFHGAFFILPTGVGIELPETEEHSYTRLPTGAVLTLNKNRMILFNGQNLTMDELKPLLASYATEKKLDTSMILIKADKEVFLEEILSVCDIARQVGLNVQIATQEKKVSSDFFHAWQSNEGQ